MENSLVVVTIHNNSLGRIWSATSYDEGHEMIRKLAQEQMDRDLTQEEIDGIEGNNEFSLELDHDNSYCWSLGIVEDWGKSL